MATASKIVVRVREIMTPEPVCVERSTTLRELARLLEEWEISGAPVLDSDGSVIGVVSKTDLVRRCMEGSIEGPPGYLFELLADEAGEEVELEPEREPIVVEDFMTPDPLTASPDEPIATVARRMAEAGVHRIVVVDEERVPLGIVTSLDLLRVFPQAAPKADS